MQQLVSRRMPREWKWKNIRYSLGTDVLLLEGARAVKQFAVGRGSLMGPTKPA